MPRYIDAEILNDIITENKHNSDQAYWWTIFSKVVDRVPTAEVVEKKFFDCIERRLKHLLQSKFIALFDAHKPRSDDYARDIEEADKIAFNSIPAEKTDTLFKYCPFCGKQLTREGAGR